MTLVKGMHRIINELTQDIIEIYNITIPISNIDDVVKSIGGVVRKNKGLSKYSNGYIRKVDDGFEIIVSEQQPEKRRNFTIAHELGHLFLHMGYAIDPDKWEKQEYTYYREDNPNEEYEANEFAAALLMPQKEYKKVMDKYTDGNLLDTSKIADEFNVSVNAAANRGKWLGYLQ